jgi:hypothetical protein
MTYAHNDVMKLDAIDGWCKFAPITKAGFLVARAKDKLRNSLVHAPGRAYMECRDLVQGHVYMACVNHAAELAARFDHNAGKKSKDQRAALIGLLPFLTELLDEYDHCACGPGEASVSILAIIKATGAPEALLAFIHNLGGPNLDASVKALAATGQNVPLARLKELRARSNDEAAKKLCDLTGEDFGPDAAKWVAWYNKNAQSLFFDFKAGKFIIDAKAAAEARK